MRSALFLGVAVALVATAVSASANGQLYECDSARLSSENLCYFVATSSNTVGASAHNINRAVAADGYRKIVGSTGTDVTLSPRPWTQGEMLAASSTEITGDNLAWVKAFEMIAPLRDAMMYAPETVTANTTRWLELTKALTDCSVKAADHTETINGREATVYGVTGVYTLLGSPSGSATPNHGILQFLEEGAVDLVCVMAPSLVMDRCDVIRGTLGLASGAGSTCWEAAYTALYGTYNVGTTPGAASSPAPATDSTTPVPGAAAARGAVALCALAVAALAFF